MKFSIRFYTCLVCRGLAIASSNDEKTMMFEDICFSCERKIVKFHRLTEAGIIKENKINAIAR